jgi:hypothetical protein
LVGCSVGEVPSGGGDGGGGNGEATFTAQIRPMVEAKGCLNTICHAPPSLQQPTLSSYAELQARFKVPPATNPIILKPNTLAADRIHQGIPYLTVEEIATVTAWANEL